MINYDLAERRNLSPDDIADLEALHMAMYELIVSWREPASPWDDKDSRKLLKNTVQHLEYMMQDKWGFSRNRQRHTHWQRFEGLYKKRKPHYPRWSTTIQKAMRDE